MWFATRGAVVFVKCGRNVSDRYDAAAFDQAWNRWYPGAAAREYSVNEFLLRVQHEANQLLARAAGP